MVFFTTAYIKFSLQVHTIIYAFVIEAVFDKVIA